MILFDPDGERSFNSFKPFAGWTEAAMVQWAIDQKSSKGLGYDGNWRPGTVTATAKVIPKGKVIPASIPSSGDATSVPQTYTVAAGDTLAGVAARFSTTAADLADLNDLINRLTSGQASWLASAGSTIHSCWCRVDKHREFSDVHRGGGGHIGACGGAVQYDGC